MHYKIEPMGEIPKPDVDYPISKSVFGKHLLYVFLQFVHTQFMTQISAQISIYLKSTRTLKYVLFKIKTFKLRSKMSIKN